MSSTTDRSSINRQRLQRQTAEAIEAGIHRAEQLGRTIDAATARAIALCLGELGSQLANFGLTGTLHRTQALLEMEWLNVDESTQLWAGALWDYLDQPRQPHHQPLTAEGRPT